MELVALKESVSNTKTFYGDWGFWKEVQDDFVKKTKLHRGAKALKKKFLKLCDIDVESKVILNHVQNKNREEDMDISSQSYAAVTINNTTVDNVDTSIFMSHHESVSSHSPNMLVLPVLQFKKGAFTIYESAALLCAVKKTKQLGANQLQWTAIKKTMDNILKQVLQQDINLPVGDRDLTSVKDKWKNSYSKSFNTVQDFLTIEIQELIHSRADIPISIKAIYNY